MSRVKELFDCKNLARFLRNVVAILDYGGSSGAKFFLCKHSNIEYLTKLYTYYKPHAMIDAAGEVSDLPPTRELRILEALKKKVISTKVSPCVVELLYVHECDTVAHIITQKECTKITEPDYPNSGPDYIKKLFCDYKRAVAAGLAFDKCTWAVLERCDMSLSSYIQRGFTSTASLAVFNTILFQTIYTFRALRILFPKMRHWDLHPENVMLKFDKKFTYRANHQRYLKFTIDGVVYYVPYYGIIAKIIDFDLAEMPEEGIILSSTLHKVREHYRGDNEVLFLMHGIYTHVEKLENAMAAVGALDILEKLDPTRSYIKYDQAAIQKAKPPSYKKMLKNQVFSMYREPQADSSVIAAFSVEI